VRGEQLEAEAVANRKFDKFWAQEEVWIRKGIEARRTRNEGRVRRLEALREARAARRERTGQIRLEVDAGERSGKLVCETRQAGISLGGRCLVRDLDLTIMRGDRIGLIGPNGIGKSTLLKLILGEYPPDTGSVRLGSNLQIAYFDQLREQLDPEQSVANTVSPGSEYVEINGARRHIMSYLQDFLFPSNRANSPVRTLSGGERNRLLLARLFARPANLLVLDEPTNDLDLESIDLLESMLQSYPGTLLLVSHDRRFLDNVVTSVLVAQGDGHWLELVGGYSDWLAWRQTQPNQAPSGFGAAVIASSSGQAGAEGSDTANRAASTSGAQAAGAGMSLALACDLRVAEPRTKLNIAYGMIGASTDGGMSWFLPRYAGFSAATELLYTQPVLRAARAQELSLVHRVSEPGELNTCAEQLAEQIAGSASHTVRAAKSMLAARYVVELGEHMHAEHEFFARGVLTEDFRNAVHAMQRGEIPSFD